MRWIDKITGTRTKLEELPKIVERIAKLNGVKAVYLFGSQISGKTHIHSDIDICVIGEKEEDEKLEDELLEFMTDNLEVIYFWRLPIWVKFRVLREGKPLIIKDKNFVDECKIKTMNEYFDYQPTLNKFCMETLGCTI